jgi:hypothetical protein
VELVSGHQSSTDFAAEPTSPRVTYTARFTDRLLVGMTANGDVLILVLIQT